MFYFLFLFFRGKNASQIGPATVVASQIAGPGQRTGRAGRRHAGHSSEFGSVLPNCSQKKQKKTKQNNIILQEQLRSNDFGGGEVSPSCPWRPRALRQRRLFLLRAPADWGRTAPPWRRDACPSTGAGRSGAAVGSGNVNRTRIDFLNNHFPQTTPALLVSGFINRWFKK